MTATLSPEPVPDEAAEIPQQRPPKSRRRPSGARSLFDGAIVKGAALDSLIKLDPRTLAKNPVMFVVEVGSVLTTVLFVRDLGSSTSSENLFAGLVVGAIVILAGLTFFPALALGPIVEQLTH